MEPNEWCQYLDNLLIREGMMTHKDAVEAARQARQQYADSVSPWDELRQEVERLEAEAGVAAPAELAKENKALNGQIGELLGQVAELQAQNAKLTAQLEGTGDAAKRRR